MLSWDHSSKWLGLGEQTLKCSLSAYVLAHLHFSRLLAYIDIDFVLLPSLPEVLFPFLPSHSSLHCGRTSSNAFLPAHLNAPVSSIYSRKPPHATFNSLFWEGLVSFSSWGILNHLNNLRDFSVTQHGVGIWGASSAFQHCLSVKTLPLEIEGKKCPPPIQELCVYPGHLRSRLLIPEPQVRLQGLHSLHSPATCPGAKVLLVHSPALHHYSKSYVLGEQIRAQRKIIHWPTESLELWLNPTY